MNIIKYSHHYPRCCLKTIVNLLNNLIVRRYIRYIIFLFIIFILFNGRPKLIFRTHLHIPWLTNVQHTQPLTCLPDNDHPDWPRPTPSNDGSHTLLTVVIVTARPEFKRLPSTLAALACHLDFRRITEVLFLVPPQDVHILQPYLSPEQASYWPWPLSIVSDDILLKHIHTNSYRLQMMFKLVLAQIISTEYYLILDSDCLALWPIHVEQLLYKSQNHSSYKALYQIEGYSGHETWWSESEQLLQIRLETCVSNQSSLITMGVTPIILSRTISLRTLCRLQKLYGDTRFLNKMANWALWRLLSGRMWTEYTLYYLAARCTHIFDTYHFHYSTQSASNAVPAVNLYGLSIWSSNEWTAKNQNQLIESIDRGLKWRRKEIENANGQSMVDTSVNIHSLFTVLQGRHNVNPNLYHNLFYPIYIRYLNQQNQTEKLVEILDNMSKTLIRK